MTEIRIQLQSIFFLFGLHALVLRSHLLIFFIFLWLTLFDLILRWNSSNIFAQPFLTL